LCESRNDKATKSIAHTVHVTSNGEESQGLDYKRIASKLEVEEPLQDFADLCLGFDLKCFVDVLFVLVGGSSRRQREEGEVCLQHGLLLVTCLHVS